MTFTKAEAKQFNDAVLLAKRAHEGQTRRGSTEPYIEHPVRVAGAAAACGLPVPAVIAAILHDVVEDSSTTFEDLQRAGFSDRTIHLVRLLTKSKPYLDSEYYARVLQDDDAIALKLLDRADNLRSASLLTTKADKYWAFRYTTEGDYYMDKLLARCPYESARKSYRAARAAMQRVIETDAKVAEANIKFKDIR